MATTRTEQIQATDGTGSFAGRLTLPQRGSGPGVLLLQEIFGVNEYVHEVGERLAALGYVTLAPDLFWRQEPGVALPHDEASLGRGIQLAMGFDADKGIEDLGGALAHLRSLAEVTGGAGVLGFCFGGTMAFVTAVNCEPDAAVCYYGTGIPDLLDRAGQVSCPILFHFGSQDGYLALEQAERVATAFAGRPDAEVVIHPGAGHAFDNSFAPAFHQPDPATRAWEQTKHFLAQHLPVAPD